MVKLIVIRNCLYCNKLLSVEIVMSTIFHGLIHSLSIFVCTHLTFYKIFWSAFNLTPLSCIRITDKNHPLCILHICHYCCILSCVLIQMLVGAECILAIHRMEQISSEEGIGSLSENLMESLKPNPEVAKKVRRSYPTLPTPMSL